MYGTWQDVTPLPITLSTFEANRIDKKQAKISWTTLSERNNAYFEIERTIGSKVWETIGKVQSVGNTQYRTDYSFIDEQAVEPKLYYRLKQVDYDGKSSYSNIAQVINNKADMIQLFPNPAQETVYLVGNFSINDNIKLVSALGKVINVSQQRSEKEVVISLNGVAKGLYQVIIEQSEKRQALKLVIN